MTDEKMNEFNLWTTSCAHVGTDLRHGRKSLADALEQSESGGDAGGPSFDWDIMLDCGDLSGCSGPGVNHPDDREGRNVVDQYAVLKKHRREQVYNIAGNHDGSRGCAEESWWFQKYGDPMGQHSEVSGVDNENRPFRVEGTWERYKFQAGNILFLLMSDRNDIDKPVGRGDDQGGYPAGAVTGETVDWWVEQVESNQDRIIISVHHHMLKATTIASGEWEGFGKKDRYGAPEQIYHGYWPQGGPEGAGYLYFVDGNPDAQAFERYLEAHPGAIDLWLGGHTHAHPDDSLNGRTHIERKWGVNFVNCAALSRYHFMDKRYNIPMSRLLIFTDGSDQVRVRCYLHSSDHAPQGWYDRVEKPIALRHKVTVPPMETNP